MLRRRDRLRGSPRLVLFALTEGEEFLRWASTVYHFRCTANRDEDVFADPYRFDVTRPPNDHIAFGKGSHFCRGGALARLEMRIMFEELLPRPADVRLAGGVRRVRSDFVNGIREMPVTVALA
jgi:cytochrome P450